MSSSTPAPAPKLRAQFEAAGGKPTYVRQMFGRIARVYDLMNRLMTAGLDSRWRAFAVKQIALKPGESGLDIGTGTGDMAIALAKVSAPDSRVIGVDFTPEMLAIGRHKLQRLDLTHRVELLQDDGEHLHFPDATFDACCSAFVVRNLADLSAGFREMLRVVKPGGRVSCLEMSHPYNPLFGAAFSLYFNRIVPLLGTLVGKAFDAYSYLPTSVSTFPDAPGLKRIMEDAGWSNVHYYYRLGGAVAIHTATRPGEE
jgi:demethylmenaquinone methyltransferase / 2-methoxy-6-polyprenyl-1,4-benzoquinol methylase